jgi:ubiquinone/menaquinone biosynthesis C-methylase UbiE
VNSTEKAMQKTWEDSFKEAIKLQAFNTAPVEALVRNVSYYLRGRFPDGNPAGLNFLEMGCGAGPNLLWLAKKGIRVSGIDISPTALGLAKKALEANGCSGQVGELVEASVTSVPFKNESFDGILEACVFQHLSKEDRRRAFQEVSRLLKPGGVFVGYMLDTRHTVFQAKRADERQDDPGTLDLHDGSSKIHLTNVGCSHFFSKEEYFDLLKGFSTIDPCWSPHYLPHSEAKKRGYSEYLQSMWAVYAIK